jgi:hypothetical protein
MFMKSLFYFCRCGIWDKSEYSNDKIKLHRKSIDNNFKVINNIFIIIKTFIWKKAKKM